jgi:hypothetical protein
MEKLFSPGSLARWIVAIATGLVLAYVVLNHGKFARSLLPLSSSPASATWAHGCATSPNNAARVWKGAAPSVYGCSSIAPSNVSCYVTHAGVALSGSVVPLLVGMGPAKTSSTLTFELLGIHSGVAVGNAAPACCGSELYFFSRRFASNTTAASMSQYFQQHKPTAVWAAEKTPTYFDDPLVPFRVKALFSNVWLLFTYREPTAALVSLFFHRAKYTQLLERYKSAGKTGIDAFIDWSGQLLRNHGESAACRKEMLEEMGLDSESEADLLGVQQWEEAAYWRCHIPGSIARGDNIGHYMYSRGLQRWINIFGKHRLHCTSHDDWRQDPMATVQGMLRFLNLTPTHEYLDAVSKLVKQSDGPTPMQRLAGLANMSSPSQGNARVQEMLVKINEVYAGEYAWAKKVCSAPRRNQIKGE